MILEGKKADLCKRSFTSKLWLEYQSMVTLLCKMVHADRIGSWKLHLEAVHDSLAIFAAAGHTNYLKTAYLYIQNMLQRGEKNPRLYAAFQKGLHVVHRSDTSWSGLGSDLVIEQVLMRALKTTGGLTRGSGITEIQRALWVLSMSVCCEYNIAMQKLTSASYSTSEQHKEMHKARLSHDRRDGAQILEFLQQSSPFTSDPSLRNIVTGVTFDATKVNVHDLRTSGRQVVDKLPGNDVFTFSCKRADRVQTLASVEKMRIDDKEYISVDPALLFQRLIVAASSGAVNLQEALQYELCSYPPSLFESSTVLRKAQKSQIAHCITVHVKTASEDTNQEEPASQQAVGTQIEPDKPTKYVLDGGSLLHRLAWKTGETYDSIAKSYANFTVLKYDKATVVFDGYDVSNPSIKDCAHRRRGMNSKLIPTVNFLPETALVGKKDRFLLNAVNKSRMLKLISDHLVRRGCKVVHAKGDADVDIVQESVISSKETNTIVVGEDSDLLILLLNYSSDCQFSLQFRSDVQRQKSTSPVYDIHLIRQVLGPNMCMYLLFLHAFTGCDTTSHIHGIGMSTAFKKLMNSDELQNVAEIFCKEDRTQAEIEDAGKKAILLLYGCRKDETLQELRYRVFKEKVASSKTFVKPERLPPTESAVKYHAFRTYFQILQWMKKNTEDACSWGWLNRNNEYFPKLSDLPPAPSSLLSLIRCKCMKGCDDMRCSCRKMGLPCTDVCGQCHGSSCENVSQDHYMSDSEESDIE